MVTGEAVAALTPLEQIDRTIADLEQSQSVLLALLANGAEELQAARVEAMTHEPGKRATAAGAASKVYKLAESLREAELKLSNVELDLEAAGIVRQNILEGLAEDARKQREKTHARLLREEQAAIDEFKTAAAGVLEAYADYRVVAERRRDELGGGDEFQPAMDPSRTTSAAVMFDAVTNTRVPHLEERAQARPGAVIPIPRSDPRWARLARPFRPTAGAA
jgi:hypothetical protein